MRSGVIAQKVGMTRIFTDAGEHIPVTVLKLDHCQVVGHRTSEKNGYIALQLGAGRPKVKRLSRAARGHFAVANVEPKRKLAEFRVSPDNVIEVGADRDRLKGNVDELRERLGRELRLGHGVVHELELRSVLHQDRPVGAGAEALRVR